MLCVEPGAVYAALPTFFDPGGGIDARAQAHLAEYLSARPLDGFLLLSEVAEAAQLSEAEQGAILDDLAPRLGERPFWVQISSPSTRIAGELAERAERAGAQALLIQAYLHPGLGYRELYRHVELIARRVSLPLILGARALSAAAVLAPEELKTLALHPRVAGIFLPGRARELVSSWSKRLAERPLGVVGGCALDGRDIPRAGVRANACGLAVIATDPAVELREAARAGAQTVVDACATKLRPLVDQLGPERDPEERGGIERLASRIADRALSAHRLRPLANPALIKEALRLQGHPVTAHLRAPGDPLRPEDSDKLQALLRLSGL